VDPTGVILITGCNDVSLAVDAMRAGALNYVVKPVDLDQLGGLVENALELQRQRALLQRKAHRAAHLVCLQQQHLNRVEREVDDALQRGFSALLETIPSAREDGRRVERYASYLGKAMGLSQEELEQLRWGALLHDIGTIGLADQTVSKSGPLTDSEWRQMRQHPEIGYQILKKLKECAAAADLVRAHHERFDGSGYPYGLSGNQIPLGARLFSIVDAFDAMTSARPYRKLVRYEEAAKEILRCSGTQFDPTLVGQFLTISPATWDTLRSPESGMRPAPMRIPESDMMIRIGGICR
jgi:putative nucleotidyltransferase with HDIG domain